MRKFALAALMASIAAVVAGIGPAQADDAIVTASLNGAKEVNASGVPNQGDPDATGTATIFIDDDSNMLCLFMRWSNVDGTTSGLHIHFAPPTSPGPIVVPFATPAPGRTSTFQCVTVANEALLDNIAANPQQYYINLHSTPTYPAGAIRGQLQAT